MNHTKTEILKNLCYTELVYGRINKKLSINLSNQEIETLLFKTINATELRNFVKIGKNFYVSNLEKMIQITINSYTYRVITVDKI